MSLDTEAGTGAVPERSDSAGEAAGTAEGRPAAGFRAAGAWRRFWVDTWWVAWRELKHYVGQKVRIVITLIQPLIWLAFMGNMFQRVAMVPGFPAARYLDYMAPGIVVMVTLFGGIFGGMSIVWDRRFGYLNKLLAAPIVRSSVVTGKMLAVAVQTAIQALVVFAVALTMGVGFKAGPAGVPALVILAALLSLVFGGLSLALSAVLTTHEALMAVVNFITMPLMFTSNAMMPLSFMPAWLAAVARVNPLSYAIDPLRSLFLVGWDWWALAQGILVLGLAAAAMAALASALFRRSVA
ncbi:MAG: ABC transporter permease [Acetobacteraceae bacterium]|nr:ABC transporter permease [Acetobacteraceae bacterium]